MIDIDQLQSLLAKNSFEISIDPGTELNSSWTQFNCSFRGKKISFEYFYEPIEDTMFAVEDHPEIKNFDTCIGFQTSADENAIICAVVISGLIANHCNGAYWLMDRFEKNTAPIDMAKHVYKHALDIIH
ncbi:hypothetical protein C8D91_0779 [Marinicella litoralis]|uniref:Uncharacterized protein n=2 Tax=Marinicella litoralis TaxID=644220 RepID=A0A4V3DIJ1_9GAMM|nr:hypothetical protein C8D91_0779 [Marinicella litoralis]